MNTETKIIIVKSLLALVVVAAPIIAQEIINSFS